MASLAFAKHFNILEECRADLELDQERLGGQELALQNSKEAFADRIDIMSPSLKVTEDIERYR
jgi:hypothetical protein